MKSTINTLHILELIATQQPLGVNELVEQLNQPKTNVQRALTTLSKAGWIRKAYGDEKGWVLTSKLFVVANQSHSLVDLHNLASPHIRELHRTTQETVFLSSYDNDQMTVIDVIQGTKGSLAVVAVAGDAYPMYISAPGKACLAYMKDEVIVKFLTNVLQGEEYHGRYNVDELLKEIAASRRLGYATVEGDVSEYVVSVGAGIVDSENKPIGGIGISIPCSRGDASTIKSHGRLLKAIAREVTLSLRNL